MEELTTQGTTGAKLGVFILMLGTFFLSACGNPLLQETKETSENYLGSVKIEPTEARYELREINDQVYVFDNEMARLWLLRQDPEAGVWLKPVMFENETGNYATMPIVFPLVLQSNTVEREGAETLNRTESISNDIIDQFLQDEIDDLPLTEEK